MGSFLSDLLEQQSWAISFLEPHIMITTVQQKTNELF